MDVFWASDAKIAADKVGNSPVGGAEMFFIKSGHYSLTDGFGRHGQSPASGEAV